MNNPLDILQTLNRHLTQTTELTLFGRSVLALGFAEASSDYGATLDVDGIIPATTEGPGVDFWLAQQATNAELRNRGLYITHLFSELDVILEPDWQRKRVPLDLSLSSQKLCEAFTRARVPDVPEIRELFLAAQPKVLRLAGEIFRE